MNRVVNHGLVRLTLALIETKNLREWFLALRDLPADCRGASLSRMATDMREDGEDPLLADAVGALTNPKIYKSVLQTVQERVAQQEHDRLQ